jgi:hypothetical protein
MARFVWSYCHVWPHTSIRGKTPHELYSEAEPSSHPELPMSGSGTFQKKASISNVCWFGLTPTSFPTTPTPRRSRWKFCPSCLPRCQIPPCKPRRCLVPMRPACNGRAPCWSGPGGPRRISQVGLSPIVLSDATYLFLPYHPLQPLAGGASFLPAEY